MPARLDETVPACREALQELIRERVPLQWAASTGNQGIALMVLAERRGGAEMATLAAQQIEAALTASRDSGNAPSAAMFAATLPSAETEGNTGSRRRCGKHTCDRRTTSPGALKQLRGSASPLRSDL